MHHTISFNHCRYYYNRKKPKNDFHLNLLFFTIVTESVFIFRGYFHVQTNNGFDEFPLQRADVVYKLQTFAFIRCENRLSRQTL